MSLLYHAYVYLEFLILACTIYILAPSNVKREVEKYMGDLDIKVKKNEFSVTILLQERRTENEY